MEANLIARQPKQPRADLWYMRNPLSLTELRNPETKPR